MAVKAHLLCAVALVMATATALDAVAQQFNAFKNTHQRRYDTPAEEARRLAIFGRNMATARQLQSLNPLATFGASPFADMDEDEFLVYHGAAGYFASVADERRVGHQWAAEDEGAAKSNRSIDWRTKGAVTPVKNQGKCGSCWTFSTTGNIEGQWAIAGNPLTSLSEQELVSCDTTGDGCQGGTMPAAFAWLIQNRSGWIATEAAYPYTALAGKAKGCNIASEMNNTGGAQIKGFVEIPQSEKALADYCYANGPVSIAVDATSWQHYTGGILTHCPKKALDHGVLVVGFDDAHTPPYWIIKNSWTQKWGEAGYIRVAKGKNLCLVASAASSATMKAQPNVTRTG